ncbi:MAG TPA: sigma-70 family RNA polymerase sigma factor [Planctomycetota bacterium]|nr:sigma-70 family RNA polymerase sigma factor [Planctomycetota bacterium]
MDYHKAEEDLVRRIAAGDSEAFEKLYEAYRKPLANYLYRLCFDRALVEDLLQEVFVRIWRAAASFRAESKVSTFIFRIATNVWINESRRLREKPAEAAADRVQSGEPGEELERREREARVRDALRTLPAGERAVLILAEYNGLPYEEIARVLEVPVGTVKSRMFHALQRLRDRLRNKF